MDPEQSRERKEALLNNSRAAERYRRRRTENPYTHAAAQWAKRARHELKSDKEMRFVANDLCRRVAFAAERRGVSPETLTDLFAHVDRSAASAIREGMATEVFKDAYIREHQLAESRRQHLDIEVDSAEAAVTREAPSPEQAQQAHGPAFHPESFTHHQAEPFSGRNLPIPDPRLPAIHDYMPGRTEQARPGSAHDPGAVSSALRGLPFGGRLPSPPVQGASSGAPAPNAYGPPTAWKGQSPSQGGPQRLGRR